MSIQYLNNEISGTPKKNQMEPREKENLENFKRSLCLHSLLLECVCVCVTSFSTCPDNSNYPLLIKYVNARRRGRRRKFEGTEKKLSREIE